MRRHMTIALAAAALALTTACAANVPAADNAGNAEALQTTPTAAAFAAAISAEEAQAIALEHAGLAESDVTFIYAVPDYDDGRGVYDVEFYRGAEEYDYEISAADGSILSYDHEIEGRMAGAEGAPSATQNAAVPSPIAPLTPSDVALTQGDAKRIALETAKVSEADATFTSVEFDYDDGIASYQVDFVVDATEYEFEIDANTGAVLEYGTESIYD